MEDLARDVDDLHRSVADVKDQLKAINHGCDIFAKATTKSNSELTKRVDSLTTFMESQSQKQDSRIDALAKRIEAQSKSIARLETIFLDDKASGRRIQSSKPSSSNNEDQVPFFHNLENQDEIPLGYRGIRSSLENRNGLWKKIELPIFDGKYPSIWLNRAERYFRLGKYSDQDKLELIVVSFEGAVLSWFITEKVADPFRDWDDFKSRLVKQYRTVKSYSPVAGNDKNESNSQGNVALEIEVVQRTESSELEEHHLQSGNCNALLMQDMVEMHSAKFHQNCSSSEPKMIDVVLNMVDMEPHVLSKKDSISEIIQDPESLCVADSSSETQSLMPKAAEVHKVVFTAGMELKSRIAPRLDTVKSHSLSEVQLMNDSNSTTNVVHASNLVHKTVWPFVEETYEKLGHCEFTETQICGFDNFASSEERDIRSYIIFTVFKIDKSGEMSHTLTRITKPSCAQHVFTRVLIRSHKLQQKQKRSLSPKSWKFKFKNRVDTSKELIFDRGKRGSKLLCKKQITIEDLELLQHKDNMNRRKKRKCYKSRHFKFKSKACSSHMLWDLDFMGNAIPTTTLSKLLL